MQYQRLQELTAAQVDDLHEMFAKEWWTSSRAREELPEMLKHSNLILGYADVQSGRLLAFSRVLTDYCYKAIVLDVIVREDHRGTGLGRVLVDQLLALPKLSRVEHIELYCVPSMLSFYRQWGFLDMAPGLQFMRLTRPSSGGREP